MTAPMVAPVEARFRATGISEVQRGLRLVGSAGEATGRQVGGSMRQIAGGVEMIARQGKVTGESLKSIIAQGAEMAFMFGAAGPIVGALGIVGVAIYEQITNRMKEAREEINKSRRDLEGLGDLASAGRAQQMRFSGNPNAIRMEGESNAAYIARRFGITGVRGRIDELRDKLPQNILGQLDAGRRSFGGLAAKGVNDAANEMGELLTNLARLKTELAQNAEITKRLADAEGQRAKTEVSLAAAAEARLNAPLSQTHPAAWAAALAQVGKDNANDPAAALRRMGVQITPGQIQSPGPIGGLDGHRTFGIKAADLGDQINTKFVTPLAESITRSIGDGIGNAISAGFDAAFAKGANIGRVAAAFGATALQTIGGVFKDIGMQSLMGLQFMAAIKAGIATWNPALGIAASIGLIALGSALQSAGGRIGANAAGGGGGGGSSGSSSLPTIIDRGFINPSSAVSAAGSVSARATIVMQPVIIGPNDPIAQRGILELMRNAERRGGI